MLIYNRTEKNGVNKWVEVKLDGSAVACVVGVNFSLNTLVDNTGTKRQVRSEIPKVSERKLDFSGEIDLRKKAREFVYGNGV